MGNAVRFAKKAKKSSNAYIFCRCVCRCVCTKEEYVKDNLVAWHTGTMVINLFFKAVIILFFYGGCVLLSIARLRPRPALSFSCSLRDPFFSFSAGIYWKLSSILWFSSSIILFQGINTIAVVKSKHLFHKQLTALNHIYTVNYD